MQGQEVNYNAPITLKEVQYVTFPGEVIPDDLYVGLLLKVQAIPYNKMMKVRDIYNYMIALYGYKPGFSIEYNKKILNFNDTIPERVLTEHNYNPHYQSPPLLTIKY